MSKRVRYFAYALPVIAFALAVVVWYLNAYVFTIGTAKSQLTGYTVGNIVPAKTELTTFKGQTLQGATTDQKALVSSAYPESSKSAVFVFTPDNATDVRTVDTYVSFGSQTSRDFMLINQSNLENLVKSGKAVIKVHPVPGGSAYSMYAAQTVADALDQHPSVAWELMFELMKASAKASDMTELEEVRQLIVETAHEAGFTEMKTESLTEGRFSSWLISVGDDEVLQNSFAPPILMVNGHKVDPELTNYNLPDEVMKSIIKK